MAGPRVEARVAEQGSDGGAAESPSAGDGRGARKGDRPGPGLPCDFSSRAAAREASVRQADAAGPVLPALVPGTSTSACQGQEGDQPERAGKGLAASCSRGASTSEGAKGGCAQSRGGGRKGEGALPGASRRLPSRARGGAQHCSPGEEGASSQPGTRPPGQVASLAAASPPLSFVPTARPGPQPPLRTQAEMWSDKMEKRVASSIFITLVPPSRDPLAKGKAMPTGALRLPLSSSPHQEALTPAGPSPAPASTRITTGGRGHSPGETGGAPPAPFSVETLGPGLERQVEALQPPSRVPAEARQTPPLPTNLRPAGELQAERRVEAATAAAPTGEDTPDICAFCHKALSARALAIEAMNRQYHAGCFTCRRCHCALAGQRFYQEEGRPLCVGCYKSTLEKCARCQALILDQLVRAMGSAYHPECFTCVACGQSIGDEAFAVDEEAGVHCLPDFYRKCASVCCACGEPIIPSRGRDSYRIECLGRHFHEDCYRCEVCRVQLSLDPTEGGCFPLGLRLLCKACHTQQKKQLSR